MPLLTSSCLHPSPSSRVQRQAEVILAGDADPAERAQVLAVRLRVAVSVCFAPNVSLSDRSSPSLL